MELELTTYALLWLVALCAGFIDAIAGGGGLLTVPALSFTAMDMSMILGTNKAQGIAGSFSSSLKFLTSKSVKIREILFAVICSFVGGVLGSITVQNIDSNILRPFIVFMLFAVSLFFLFSPQKINKSKKPKLSHTVFALSFGFAIGYYDGFFGPGAGAFFTMALMFFVGYNLRSATMRARMLNFASNLGALLFFIIAGKVFWPVALIMATGQFIGARMGALMVLKKATIIRPFVIAMSLLMSLKLLADIYL